MKDKTNEQLKLIVDNSGWARLDYELKNDTIENIIKNLNELQTIPVIDEILERLDKTEVSYSNFEKLKQKIVYYQKKKKEYSKYYEIYDEKIKREKYKYDTTEDCLKIIRSAFIEIIDDNHFGLSLTHYEASNFSEMANMINDNLGWGVDREGEFTEEQEYKWEQIKRDLPTVLKNLIK
jgi:hypothetical protein